MVPLLIKAAVSAAISFFSTPPLAEMCWRSGPDIPKSFLAVTYLLVFLWSYFSLSATAYALHLGMGFALIVGILSIAIGGAIAMADAFFFVDIFANITPDDIKAYPTDLKEFWILMLISVVLFLVFPIIDIILMIKKIRDGEWL